MALAWLERQTASRGGRIAAAGRALFTRARPRHAGPLARLGFGQPAGLSERFMRKLAILALEATAAEAG